jgi:sensor histidine kinase YesM
MEVNPVQLAASLPRGKLYWRCQMFGWSAFSAFEFAFVMAFWGDQARIPFAAGYTGLVGLQGVAGTHLFHFLLRNRQWVRLPPKALTGRLVGGIISLAAVLALLALVTRSLIAHVPVVQIFKPMQFFVVFAIRVVVLVIWTALYVAIHELQLRRDTERKALRLEVVAQEAQLRGLRGQLNPHFFFNCLNNLRELIVEDPRRAQRMVTQLGALLRYSLRADQPELVSLADEVRALEDYLALESIRFEERLQVRWDIAKEVQGIRVPPMLLQTLVENALKHGIARRPQGGEITIAARLTGANVELEVLNSGELREPASSMGIGLRNARERLGLLYGDRAGLVLQNGTQGQVSARVTLPLPSVEVST